VLSTKTFCDSQDTSAFQYQLINTFFNATEGCVTVVGDPDQASEYLFMKHADIITLTSHGKSMAGEMQVSIPRCQYDIYSKFTPNLLISRCHELW
jgi:hypothetical protein